MNVISVTWARTGDTSAGCEGCGWTAGSPSPSENSAAAREHTADTGHVTRAVYSCVTRHRPGRGQEQAEAQLELFGGAV